MSECATIQLNSQFVIENQCEGMDPFKDMSSDFRLFTAKYCDKRCIYLI